MTQKKPTLKELVAHQKKVTKATMILDATAEDVDWLHSTDGSSAAPAATSPPEP